MSYQRNVTVREAKRNLTGDGQVYLVWNIFGCMQVEAEEASGKEESSSIHDISDCIAPERDSQPTLVSDHDPVFAVGFL